MGRGWDTTLPPDSCRVGGQVGGGLIEQPRSHRVLKPMKQPEGVGKGGKEGEGRNEPCRGKAQDRIPGAPGTFSSGKSWSSLGMWPGPPVGGVPPGSWSLCWSMCSRFSRRRSTWALIWLSSPLMECSSSVWTVWRGAKAGVPPGPEGRGLCCQGSPACLLRSAQLFPSSIGKGCAPVLTLYLLSVQVALPGALVGTEAALDPQAHPGPPDLDRHVTDEWRDPLVFIRPTGTGQRGSQANQLHLFTQRTEG